MKLGIIIATFVGLIIATAEPAQAGVGSCYEPKPFCFGGHPTCICDLTMNCMWACR